MNSILSFNNVSFYYEEGDERVDILKNLNLKFELGKYYALVGPSGSGKTTTLALASALDTPQSGEVRYKDQNIQVIGLTQYRKKHVAIVFQSYNLIHYMTALENVTTAMDISGVACDDPKKRALDLLKAVGLTESQANRSVLKLSGGQQQRVGIARALASDADIILADEPTGNLDQKTAKDIIDIFKKLAHDYGKCVIIVTHDEQIAQKADIIHRFGAF